MPRHLFPVICLCFGTTFGFPFLEENAPYCIVWKNRKVELPLRESGNVHIVPGDSLVFQFGKWTDANKVEYEAHYVLELDSSKKRFSGDTAGKKIQTVYYSMSSLGNSEAKVLPRVKIKGIRTSDSTWVIHEWFSPEFEGMFGSMPYKLRKQDRRIKTGYRRLCKEASNP